MSIDSAKKSSRGRPTVDTEAVNVRMERSAISAVDDWRRSQPDVPTRPEAIRRLIEAGLRAHAPPVHKAAHRTKAPTLT
jgi:hypothetical protein